MRGSARVLSLRSHGGWTNVGRHDLVADHRTRARPSVAPARVPAVRSRSSRVGGSSLFGRSTNALARRARRRRRVAPRLGRRRQPARLRRGVHRDGRATLARRLVRLPPAQRLAPAPRLPDPPAARPSRGRRALVPDAVGRVLGGCTRALCMVDAPATARPASSRPGLLAVSAFQLIHGRTGRMYAELELLGVVAAVLSDGWLRRPRRWHAPGDRRLRVPHPAHARLGIPARRRPVRAPRHPARPRGLALARRDRGAVGSGGRCCGGRRSSSKRGVAIPTGSRRTTVDGMVHTFARLVAYDPQLHVIVLLAVVAGGVVVWRRDRQLGRVLVCCAVVPALLAAATGTVAPVLLDRTLTFAAWGPLLAIGFLVGAIAQRSRASSAPL